jgi:transcriptional repressor NrdR
MNCPKSPFGDTKVIESRIVADGTAIRRRRECLDKPKHRFTTYERIERPNLAVIKKDGERQMFDRSKLMTGIQRACEKTSVTAEQMENLVAQVEEELYSRGDNEIPAQDIGELVVRKLADLNDVAYVRFASVYRNFTDIENFEKELTRLKKRLYNKK